jgi:hypothetical protein
MKRPTKPDLPNTEASTTTEVRPTKTAKIAALAQPHDCLKEISRIQSIFDEHQAAIKAREASKAEHLSAVDKRITNNVAGYIGSERVEALMELVALEVAKERIPALFDKIVPEPELDTARLEEELYQACRAFTNVELDILSRVHEWHRQTALRKLAETLGPDITADPEEVDREALAAASPPCRRLDAMFMARQGFFRLGFRLDLETDYRAVYRARLDELGRELELIEGELPPPRAREPDRQLTPMIVSRPQEPDELPPPGWTARRGVSS